MKLIDDPAFEVLLSRLNAIGCEVEFVPLVLEGADGREHSNQREAALQTLQVLKARNNWPQMTIDPTALDVGLPCLPDEFLGSHCDVQNRRLLFRGTTKEHFNHLFWFGDEEASSSRVGFKTPWSEQESLSYAFLSPPYGLRGTRSECNAVFFDALDLLLGGMRGEYAIYRWSDAASNYFDAGREWWGTFFWTAHEIGTDHILGIAASSTD